MSIIELPVKRALEAIGGIQEGNIDEQTSLGKLGNLYASFEHLCRLFGFKNSLLFVVYKS